MTDLEAASKAEQDAEAPEPPAVPQLFDADQRYRLRCAAMQYRHAARTLEALAIEAIEALRDAHIRGAARFVREAAELYGEVLTEAGLEE